MPYIADSDDELVNFSNSSSDMDTLSDGLEESSDCTVSSAHNDDGTTPKSTTTHQLSSLQRMSVASEHYPDDEYRSRGGAVGGTTTVVTANLLAMLARGPVRGGRDVSGSSPMLSRQNSLPKPVSLPRYMRQNSSLDSGLDSSSKMNIIAPGSPKVIVDLMSDEQATFPQKKGGANGVGVSMSSALSLPQRINSLTSLPSSARKPPRHPSTSNSRLPDVVVVHQHGDMRQNSPSLDSGLDSNKSKDVRSIIKKSPHFCGERRSSGLSNYRRRSSTLGGGNPSMSMENSSTLSMTSFLSPSSSCDMSPRQRQFHTLQLKKRMEEEERRMKLMCFMGAATKNKGVVGD